MRIDIDPREMEVAVGHFLPGKDFTLPWAEAHLVAGLDELILEDRLNDPFCRYLGRHTLGCLRAEVFGRGTGQAYCLPVDVGAVLGLRVYRRNPGRVSGQWVAGRGRSNVVVMISPSSPELAWSRANAENSRLPKSVEWVPRGPTPDPCESLFGPGLAAPGGSHRGRSAADRVLAGEIRLKDAAL